MKKLLKFGICGLAGIMMLSGCSKKTSTEETTTAAETAEEDMGTVTLGDYKGVEVTLLSTEVSDEEIENAIQQALTSNPEEIEVTDRAAQEGDTVNIDYVGMKDGKAFDGGTAEGYDLKLGSNSFIDGFEDGIVGAKTGDELSLNLTFPENYPAAELAGAAVVFDVTVNRIFESHDAVLDDAFVQKVSDCKTVDEYRAQTKNTLEETKEKDADNQKQVDALIAVIDKSTFDIPAETIEADYQSQLDQMNTQLTAYNITLADYVANYGMDEETYKDQLRMDIESNIKAQLVIDAVVAAEKIEITDEDREALAAENGVENAAALVETYGQEAVDATVLRVKVMQFLAEHAVVKQG